MGYFSPDINPPYINITLYKSNWHVRQTFLSLFTDEEIEF